MKYWKDDAIFEVNCPKCGKVIEFYKDDTTRKCRHCDHRLVNPKMDFGCASYCQFAEQCMGTLPEEFMGSREDLLKDKVAVAMKRFFQTDFKSIRKATSAARHAENIGKAEGGNLAVILCAVYLHGTGLENARSILAKVGASEPLDSRNLPNSGNPEQSAPECTIDRQNSSRRGNSGAAPGRSTKKIVLNLKTAQKLVEQELFTRVSKKLLLPTACNKNRIADKSS